MLLQAPKLCPLYQTGTYNISVYDKTYHLIQQVGPTEYTQVNEEEQTLIVHQIQSSFQYYAFEVTTSSVGITHTLRRTFGE